MSEQTPHGSIGWVDLTIDNAESLRDFYREVAGWEPSAVSMGDYEDYCMTPTGSDQPVAGICHRRGDNSAMPAQWMLYITVPDLQASLKRSEELGAEIVVPTRGGGSGKFCVIKDPAGALVALYQQ